MTNHATPEDLILTAEVNFAPDSAEDLADGIGDKPRRFEGVAYTGAVVDRLYGKLVIDVGGIEERDRVPMLVDHDPTRIAGYADKMQKDERGNLRLAGRLSGITDAGREVAGLSDEGFPWQMSVGLRVLEREDFGPDEVCNVNGEEIPGPLSCARRTQLRETSFLYAGADAMTSAVALSQTTNAEEVEAMAETDTPDVRAELSEFLAAFEGEEALAAVRFAEGKTIAEVRLELAERSIEELATVRKELAAVTAERDELKEKLGALADLEVEAGEPGLGFNGAARDSGAVESLEAAKTTKTPRNYDELWEQSEKVRGEFNDDREAFAAYCRARRPSIKELL